jgi:hypothetical protein
MNSLIAATEIVSGNWNSTQSNVMVSNTAGLAPILFIGLLLMAVVGLAIIITSLEQFSWFMNLIDNAIHSVRYTIYGVGITFVGALLYAIFVMLMTATRGFDPIWYVYGIAAYAGVTVLGWGGSKIAEKIVSMHTLYLESKVKQG